jgi:hypothetical protein
MAEDSTGAVGTGAAAGTVGKQHGPFGEPQGARPECADLTLHRTARMTFHRLCLTRRRAMTQWLLPHALVRKLAKHLSNLPFV